MYAGICARVHISASGCAYPYACIRVYTHTRTRARVYAYACIHVCRGACRGTGVRSLKYAHDAQACAHFHACAGACAPAQGGLFFCVPAYQAYQNERKPSVHRHLAWYKTWYKLGTLCFCTVTAYQPKTPQT